jgi:hypothetical protein
MSSNAIEANGLFRIAEFPRLYLGLAGGKVQTGQLNASLGPRPPVSKVADKSRYGSGMILRFLCVAAPLALAACDSLGSLNPFGQTEDPLYMTRVEGDEVVRVEAPIQDGSVLAPTIRAHRTDDSQDGTILVVEAVAPVQGYYDAHLYRRNFGEPDANGVLRYEFRVKPPPIPTPQGAEKTRIIEAADFISEGELAVIREIRIRTATQELVLKP